MTGIPGLTISFQTGICTGEDGGDEMNLVNNLNYYYMEKMLTYLYEKGLITEKEREETSRRLAAYCTPDPDYFR